MAMTEIFLTRQLRYADCGVDRAMTIRKGDEGRDERFKSLYQKYYRRMVRYYVSAFRLTEEDGEELAQDAFLRFYKAMDEYRGEAEWAFFETIALNVARNRIRSQKTAKRGAKTVDLDDPGVKLEPAAPEGPDYAERHEATRRKASLRDAIALLPEGQRHCVRLWLQDLKYEEIAEVLRISVDAVKSRLRDAKKLLQLRLGGEGGDPLPEDES
jgi:RNA polymerase sigma-70 factor, ECF subfamily